MPLKTQCGYNGFLRVCLHPRRLARTDYLSITTDQSLPDHLPHVSSLRALFTRHLDFNAVPKRAFFRHLKHFATDEREREKLEEFCSPEGAVNCSSSLVRSSTYPRNRKSCTIIRPECGERSSRF